MVPGFLTPLLTWLTLQHLTRLNPGTLIRCNAWLLSANHCTLPILCKVETLTFALSKLTLCLFKITSVQLFIIRFGISINELLCCVDYFGH